MASSYFFAVKASLPDFRISGSLVFSSAAFAFCSSMRARSAAASAARFLSSSLSLGAAAGGHALFDVFQRQGRAVARFEHEVVLGLPVDRDVRDVRRACAGRADG